MLIAFFITMDFHFRSLAIQVFSDHNLPSVGGWGPRRFTKGPEGEELARVGEHTARLQGLARDGNRRADRGKRWETKENQGNKCPFGGSLEQRCTPSLSMKNRGRKFWSRRRETSGLRVHLEQCQWRPMVPLNCNFGVATALPSLSPSTRVKLHLGKRKEQERGAHRRWASKPGLGFGVGRKIRWGRQRRFYLILNFTRSRTIR